MNSIKNLLQIFFVIIIAVSNFSCLNELQEPVMPEWDVSLTVPLVKEYTLGRITDDMNDSRITFDPSNDSQIVYRTNLKIDPIQINDPDYVLINSPVIHGKVSLSDIDFKLRENFSFESKITDYLPNLPVNTPTIVPPFTNLKTQKSTLLNSFNQISLDSAEFSIEIVNQFPIDININSLTLSNNLTGNTSDIINKNEIYVNKNSTKLITEIITKKNISNSLTLGVTVSTPGSNSALVSIDPNSLFRITFYSKRLKIQYAEASFDEQSYNFLVSSALSNLGNKIQINQAKIKNGKLTLALNNYSGMSGRFQTNIPELTNNSIPFGTSDIALAAKGSASRTYYLAGFVLNPSNQSVINLTNSVTINSTYNQIVKIYGTDSITYSVELKDLEIESFSGYLTGNINQSFSLPKADIDKYFNGNVVLKSASASIVVNNGSALPFNITNGTVYGYNKISGKTQSIKIKDAALTPQGTTRIPIDDVEFTKFLNDFTSQNALPASFNYNTQVDMTTNNQNYTFSNRDTIGGFVDLKVPLYIALSQLKYSDSADVTLSESDKTEMNKVNYGKLTIKASNQIPLEGNLVITFYNKNSKAKLTLPKNQATNGGYKINASQTDNSGYSTGETISILTEELTKDDIIFLSNSNLCYFDVIMNSASQRTVFLKRDDKIKLNIISEFGYKIKSN
jgi:hypothetical protein